MLALHSWAGARWGILQWAAPAHLCSSHFIADIFRRVCVRGTPHSMWCLLSNLIKSVCCALIATREHISSSDVFFTYLLNEHNIHRAAWRNKHFMPLLQPPQCRDDKKIPAILALKVMGQILNQSKLRPCTCLPNAEEKVSLFLLAYRNMTWYLLKNIDEPHQKHPRWGRNNDIKVSVSRTLVFFAHYGLSSLAGVLQK